MQVTKVPFIIGFTTQSCFTKKIKEIVVSRQISKCQNFIFDKYHVNKCGQWAERIFILDNCTERPIESLSLLHTNVTWDIYIHNVVYFKRKKKRGEFYHQ